MNKFDLDKRTFIDGFEISVIIAVVLLLAANISNTATYVVFILASTFQLPVYLYFSFLEKSRVVLDKWLAKSAIVYYHLVFMSMLAYLDIA